LWKIDLKETRFGQRNNYIMILSRNANNLSKTSGHDHQSSDFVLRFIKNKNKNHDTRFLECDEEV